MTVTVIQKQKLSLSAVILPLQEKNKKTDMLLNSFKGGIFLSSISVVAND